MENGQETEYQRSQRPTLRCQHSGPGFGRKQGCGAGVKPQAEMGGRKARTGKCKMWKDRRIDSAISQISRLYRFLIWRYGHHNVVNSGSRPVDSAVGMHCLALNQQTTPSYVTGFVPRQNSPVCSASLPHRRVVNQDNRQLKNLLCQEGTRLMSVLSTLR